MRRPLLILFGAGVICLASAASAAATTYYAKGGTSGSCTTHADPCSLNTAVGLATTNGDSVVLESGPTFVPGVTVNITHNIDIGGEAGQPMPTVQGPASNSVFSVTGAGGAGPTIHDLHLLQANANNGLRLVAGTAERMLVTVSGGERGCDVAGGILRDSLCWSVDDDGIIVIAPGGGTTFTPQLRNVTAIGGPASRGIAMLGAAGEIEHMDAVNVIARGGTTDIVTIPSGGSYTIDLRNSNYATADMSAGGSITPPGTNGNQTATPLFTNPSTGDFRELGTSPTVDTGLADPLIGSLDLDRSARTQSECLGGVAKPDIGAYELAPPQPPLLACQTFAIGKLELNKKKGTARLTVNVPGSGSLQGSGKGLKTTSAGPTAAGNVTLSLKATGKARRKLSNSGKAKLNVKLTWTPTGGTGSTKSEKIKLKKK